VTEPAGGAGKCPEEFSPERFEEVTCNVGPCPTVPPMANLTESELKAELVKCKAKVDVVFLVDGSGSLGEEGFAFSKEFVKHFAEALSDQDAQIGVILFSGPLTWNDYYECSAGIDPATNQPMDMTDDILKDVCGLQVIQQLTNDTETTYQNIDGMAFPGKTTFTSGALNLASNVLSFGRLNAEQVVVTLTDGVPISPMATKEAAKKLMGKARLVAVPVLGLGMGISDMDVMRGLASRNKDDNTVLVKDYHDMKKIETVNKLVEDVCGPAVEFPNFPMFEMR